MFFRIAQFLLCKIVHLCIKVCECSRMFNDNFFLFFFLTVNGHVSDQEGCLALTSTSEPHAGFEVRVRQVPSFESQEELLQKTVHVRI